MLCRCNVLRGVGKLWIIPATTTALKTSGGLFMWPPHVAAFFFVLLSPWWFGLSRPSLFMFGHQESLSLILAVYASDILLGGGRFTRVLTYFLLGLVQSCVGPLEHSQAQQNQGQQARSNQLTARGAIEKILAQIRATNVGPQVFQVPSIRHNLWGSRRRWCRCLLSQFSFAPQRSRRC